MVGRPPMTVADGRTPAPWIRKLLPRRAVRRLGSNGRPLRRSHWLLPDELVSAFESLQSATLVVGGGLLLASVLNPPCCLGRAQGQLTACKSNLKQLATALELHAADRQGRFPPDLSRLEHGFLRALPTCPVSHKIPAYHRVGGPEGFQLYCSGDHHHQSLLKSHPAAATLNFPRYSGRRGLLEPVP